MSVRTFIIATLGGVVAWLCFFAIAGALLAHAATNAKSEPDPDPVIWPQGPCNLEHRMDVAIIDGMFFECQCMRLHLGYECSWYLVAGVETPAEARRLKVKRHAKKGWHLAAPALSRAVA